MGETMIVKQYLDVILGDKTQTRRIAARYTVGKVYAVVPKMYKHTIYYRWEGSIPRIWHEENADGAPIPPLSSLAHVWKPLRIKIIAKRQEPLQNISEQDAIAEGIIWSAASEAFYCRHMPKRYFETAVEGYRALWESINTKQGTRWEDNPLVHAFTFEVVE